MVQLGGGMGLARWERCWVVPLVGTGTSVTGAARLTLTRKGRKLPVSVLLVASSSEQAACLFVLKYQRGHGGVDGWVHLTPKAFEGMDFESKTSIYLTLMGLRARPLTRVPLVYHSKSKRMGSARSRITLGGPRRDDRLLRLTVPRLRVPAT